MRGLIWRWVLNAAALYATAYLIDGITIDGFGAALVAALVWGLVNTLIRPVINLVTLPINILTVGLFTFVVNGFLLRVVADVVNGFAVNNFWAGVIGALVLSVFSSVLSAVIIDR